MIKIYILIFIVLIFFNLNYHSSGLKTRDKTAKAKEDFSDNYAMQVQFNPGQSEAEWVLQINSDNVYEATEHFEIILEEPVLAVLESPIVADVSIIDNEDGKYAKRNL